jgi:hypothetical protein
MVTNGLQGCGVIVCEWSFSIFIFLELLAFKLLGGG